MKRSVPADFDPVYPYGKRPLNIIPPFYSTNGFVEAPTATLSLKLANPVEFTSNGSIGLKLGGGLLINQNGELESQTITSTVNPPLSQTNGGLNLSYGNGLALDNNALIVSTTDPIVSSSNGLSLNVGDGLEVSSNGSLQAFISSGLQIVNRAIKLKVHEPLNLNETTGELQCAVGGGLTVSNNAITANVHEPLNIDSTTQKIQLRVGDGINVTNGALIARLGPGLTFENGNIKINITNPFTFTNNALNLNIGAGLHVENSQLKPKIGNGLVITSDNNLESNIGDGLWFNNGRIQVNLNSGAKGIVFENSGLKFNYGNGLQLNSNNEIEVNLSNGLTFTANSIQANLGSGLTFDSSNRIQVNLGSGITFDTNGALTTSVAAITNYTLWTTPDPSPNCNFNGVARNAKLTLSLTKVGPSVFAICHLVGLATPLSPLTQSEVACSLNFDSTGQLLPNSTLDSSYWGFRSSNSIDNTLSINRLEFMPSSIAYPRDVSSATAKSTFTTTVYQNNQAILATVYFNGSISNSSTNYHIKITFSNLSAIQNQQFNPTSFQFSYFAQQ